MKDLFTTPVSHGMTLSKTSFCHKLLLPTPMSEETLDLRKIKSNAKKRPSSWKEAPEGLFKFLD